MHPPSLATRVIIQGCVKCQEALKKADRVIPPKVKPGLTYTPTDNAKADWAGMMWHHRCRHPDDPEPPNDDEERPPPPPPPPPAQQYVRTYKAGGWWTELQKLRELQENVRDAKDFIAAAREFTQEAGHPSSHSGTSSHNDNATNAEGHPQDLGDSDDNQPEEVPLNEEGGPDVWVEEAFVPYAATADAMSADASAAEATSADAAAPVAEGLSADLKEAPASDHSGKEEDSTSASDNGSTQEQLRSSDKDQWSSSDIYGELILDIQSREVITKERD
jgi:hypothetical protein